MFKKLKSLKIDDDVILIDDNDKLFIIDSEEETRKHKSLKHDV
jgi:hypothetical protein